LVEVVFEAIEVRRPKPAVGREPVVELHERLGPNAVEAPLRVRACFDEARILEDAEVLGDGRLAEPDAVDELADGSLALPEQVEDLNPPRLGEHLECSEGPHVSPVLPYGYMPVKESTRSWMTAGRLGRTRAWSVPS
jgi:hypothetical protein